MRILIYGAGVIGSLYAALFAQTGAEVNVYARGRRLEALQRDGLRYWEHGTAHTANVQVIGAVAPDDTYDFILLAVRATQAHQALTELRANCSPTIVTMINSVEPYTAWEALCGEGRILPAFPGAGGGWRDGALDAALTPAAVQRTTFGEGCGSHTGEVPPRVHAFASLCRQAHIPYQVVPDMHAWQLCHLAMVVPLADAYYATAEPAHAGRDRALMRATAESIRSNLHRLRAAGISLSPGSMRVVAACPTGLEAAILRRVYESRFGNTFMYQHAMKAPEEMHALSQEFYACLKALENENR